MLKLTMVFYCGDARYEHTIPPQYLARALNDWRKYADTILNLAKKKIGGGATICRIDKTDEDGVSSVNLFSKKELYKIPTIFASML